MKIQHILVGIASLMIIGLIAMKGMPVQASSEIQNETNTADTIRVGYAQSDLNRTEDSGKKRGYIFDYFEALRQYYDMNIQYVEADYDVQLQMLKDHEIDVMFYVEDAVAVENSFMESSMPMIKSYGLLYTLENTPIYAEDYANLKNIQVGYLYNQNIIQPFIDYGLKHNFETKLVGYASTTEMHKALEQGTIKACITNGNYTDDRYKIIGMFETPAQYAVSYEGNPYFSNINNAMKRMNFENAEVVENLQELYIGNTAVMSLTIGEKELVNTGSTITIGIKEDKKPFMYVEHGVNKGIYVDILNALAQEMGLKFEYKMYDDALTSQEIVSLNEVDYVLDNPDFASQEELVDYSDYFIQGAFMSVVRKDSDLDETGELKIALMSYLKRYESEFREYIPNSQIVYYDTVEQVLDAVNQGEADVCLLTELRGHYLLQSPYYNDLVLTNMIEFPSGMALVATNKVGKAYLPILNKGIATLNNQNEIDLIIANDETKLYDLSPYELMVKYRAAVVGFIIGMILLIVIYLQAKQRNAKLVAINEKAQVATTVKSEFLANMSHELRTPLNAVIGLASLLTESISEPEIAKEYVYKIEQSSIMLLNIINDILDMSAMASGKIKIAHEPFSIKDSIYTIVATFHHQCVSRAIDCDIVIENMEHENLIGDSYRIQQVIINIVSNAIKFTDDGGRITMKVSELVTSNSSVRLDLEVRDTGIGMEQELLDQLFHKNESNEVNTRGLGLQICKKLVDLMDGTIDGESVKGEGSIFRVTLPLDIDEDIQIRPSMALHKLRVLIVDDQLETCKYIASILTKWKVQCEYVTDPLEALSLVEKQISYQREYNLYIIDMNMPAMNGLELSQNLRQEMNSKAAIMIITGYDVEEIRKKDPGGLIQNILRKPIFASELFNSLLEVLNLDNINSGHSLKETTLEGMKILLVEDNAINQLIARRILEQRGAQITIANNGQIAVDLIAKAKQRYNLILMDIQMPILDGYQATQAIRQLEASYAKKVPIFAMTANTFQSDIDKAYEVGMNGYIGKPVEADQLVQLLSEVYKKEG